MRIGRLIIFYWRRRTGLAIWHGCLVGLASHMASARLPPLLSAASGGAAGVPPSGCETPVGSPWPGVFARGASVRKVVSAGSGSGSGLGAGGLPDGASVGRTAGLAGGLWR